MHVRLQAMRTHTSAFFLLRVVCAHRVDSPHRCRSGTRCYRPIISGAKATSPTTGYATIVPPAGQKPVKYIVTLTPAGGQPHVFEVIADQGGYGKVRLHSLVPCTAYTITAVPVMADGFNGAPSTASFSTPST
jgi:hypothetical protein